MIPRRNWVSRGIRLAAAAGGPRRCRRRRQPAQQLGRPADGRQKQLRLSVRLSRLSPTLLHGLSWRDFIHQRALRTFSPVLGLSPDFALFSHQTGHVYQNVVSLNHCSRRKLCCLEEAAWRALFQKTNELSPLILELRIAEDSPSSGTLAHRRWSRRAGSRAPTLSREASPLHLWCTCVGMGLAMSLKRSSIDSWVSGVVKPASQRRSHSVIQ